MSGEESNLVIIGASTRAAAASARRAGLSPVCLDMFSDADAGQFARVNKVDRYPDGLIPALEALPKKMPLIYVGGLENRPDILEVAAQRHYLLGNPFESVAKARNPLFLADALRLAQVSTPEWRNHDDPPEPNGEWVLRPLFGSGGRGITSWNNGATSSPVLQEPHGFQRRIEGVPYSAVFIASEQPGDVRFVGVTRQLIGESFCHARDYQWCGNIGPVTLSVEVEHKVRRVGNIAKWKFELKGFFGVDFIVTDDSTVYVTEINPRYPASVELLEFATGQPLLTAHLQCFVGLEGKSRWTFDHPASYLGKTIYYAPKDFQVNVDLTSDATRYDTWPSIADIPAPGEEILEGQPVCTLFAEGESVERCRQQLKDRVIELDKQLFGAE